MINRFLIISVVMHAVLGCSSPASEKTTTHPNTEQINPTTKKYQLAIKSVTVAADIKDEHFRGLSIYKDQVTIAGSKGSILNFTLPLSDTILRIDSIGESLHFRDVYNRPNRQLYMSIQDPSQILMKQKDVYSVVYKNRDSLCFLDGMAFWKNGVGVIFGDPLQGKHFILKTINQGNFWERIPNDNIPTPIKNEAGFAASGTSIVCVSKGIGYIGLGGETVRVLKTVNYGDTWKSQDTPMPKNQSGTGIYSMAFKDELNGVAVGGNWEFSDCDSSKIYTTNGGETWTLSEGTQGYRSCVTYVKDNIYISTGTNGTDISIDGGKSWQLLDTIGFNAIQFINTEELKIQGLKTLGIGVGNFGQIKLIELKET